MGKTIRKVFIGFRMDKEIKDSLCVVAIKEKVKLSDIIRAAIIDYLKRARGNNG